MTQTLRQARAQVRAYGFTLTARDGEFRLRPIGAKDDAGTYYAADIDDAVATARAEHERKQRQYIVGSVDTIFAEPPVARTIDCTPTWSAILPVLLTVLEHGNADGKRTAREELKRMADAADRYNASVKQS